MEKLVVLIFGILVVAVGVILLFLPGPGLLVILFGLGLLSAKFVWAKKLIDNFKNGLIRMNESVKKIFRNRKS